jgi:hypothetical protein
LHTAARENSRHPRQESKLVCCCDAALHPRALAPLAPHVHAASRPRRRPAKPAVCRRSWGAPQRCCCRGRCCRILLVVVTLTAAIILLNLALLTHSRVAAGAAAGPSIAAGRARCGATTATGGARWAAALRQAPLAAALPGSGHLVGDDAIWRQVSIQDDLHHPLHIRHPPIHCRQAGSRQMDRWAGMRATGAAQRQGICPEACRQQHGR